MPRSKDIYRRTPMKKNEQRDGEGDIGSNYEQFEDFEVEEEIRLNDAEVDMIVYRTIITRCET